VGFIARARTRVLVLLSLVVGLALTTPGDQGVGRSAPLTTFVGDFEVGPPGWQQFDGLQYEVDRPIGESFALVDGPVRQGQRAVRMTAYHGYSRFGHNESTQLAWGGSEQEGQQYWYAWSTLFPRDWRKPQGWGIFAEWHANLSTSPIIGFSARGEGADFTVLSGLINDRTNEAAVDRVVPLLPTLSKGRWNDFVMHVRWSQRNEGFVEVFHRVEGSPALRKLVSFRNIPTFQVTRDGRGLGTYLLLGMYRASFCPQPTQLGCTSPQGVQPPSTLFHDGFVRERTFEAAVGRAFPGARPTLPPADARAVQQEGARLPDVALRAAQPFRIETEKGCKRCRVVAKGGGAVARIASARDDRDTAVLTYRVRQRDAVVLRQRLRTDAAQLAGPLVVAQLQDSRNRPLAELYVGPGGTLRLSSPKGALRPQGFDVDTGIAALPGWELRSLELRLESDRVLVAHAGRLIVRLDGLQGPRSGALVNVRIGVERYEGRSGRPVSVVYDELAVGTS
jgi:Polysaccharide lyase